MGTVILGGGLSGLSAAYYLLKKPINKSITLIESSNRMGGWIKSNKQASSNIFEQGPRTIRPRGAPGHNTLNLIEELGLSHKVLPILSTSVAAKNRMIYANGQLHLLPNTIGSLFKKQAPFSKPLIQFIAKDLFASKKTLADDSIYDFAERRFGTEFADYLISAMICGICAGNAKEISVKFLMSNFFEYEQKHGSITRGLIASVLNSKSSKFSVGDLGKRAQKENWSIYSLEGGLETLPRTLENHLRDKIEIKLGQNIKNIEFSKDAVTILNNDNQELSCEQLISSISATNLSKLVQKQHPELSNLLDQIKSVSVAVVNLEYDGDLIKNPGFGFLVPPKENLPILGVIYDSCCFDVRNNKTILTVMMGGYWFDKHFGNNSNEVLLLQTALEQLQNILKITDKPVNSKVNILRNCIPQYKVGHFENVTKIQNYVSKNNLRLHLCGASYLGVGVNDVILSAKNVCDKIM